MQGHLLLQHYSQTDPSPHQAKQAKSPVPSFAMMTTDQQQIGIDLQAIQTRKLVNYC